MVVCFSNTLQVESWLLLFGAEDVFGYFTGA